MIDREDYALLMQTLLESATESKCQHEFHDHMTRLIMTSYEINNPEKGRVVSHDVTDEIRESMGQHWQGFADLGVCVLQFLQYYIGDELILETGKITVDNGSPPITVGVMKEMPSKTLRAFAKAVALAMRKRDMKILEQMASGEFDPDRAGSSDDIGMAALIREFLAEEVDEAVAKFSNQLDAVFSVGDIPMPPPRWSPPGGEPHDLPSP
jgi:hypothetical protein